MSALSTFTYSYNRTHTATFVSDKLRSLLKVLVRDHGLDPQGLVDAWSDWVDRAVRAWLETGDLLEIVIEFYWPSFDVAVARWDIPIKYDGTGDDMWVDREFFTESFAKARRPPAGCSYRVVLITRPGRRDVPGVGATTLRSTGTLVAREAGTVIATPDIMASARYYR